MSCSFKFVYFVQLLEFGYLLGQRLISSYNLFVEYNYFTDNELYAIFVLHSIYLLVQPAAKRLYFDVFTATFKISLQITCAILGLAQTPTMQDILMKWKRHKFTDEYSLKHGNY